MNEASGPGGDVETPEIAQISGLSRQVLRRSLISIRHFRAELDGLRSAYAEREDLPGLRTLVDAMSAMLAETERKVIILSRRLYDELDAGEPDAAARFRGLVGGLLRSIEFDFPQLLAIARRPHGREIEALILPYSTLLSRLFREEPRSIEVIFEPGDEYAFERSVLERLAESAKSFTPELRRLLDDFPQLIAIAYPEQREAETLGHAMIAHEIAHNALSWTAPPNHETAPIHEAFELAAAAHAGALVERVEELLASRDLVPEQPLGDEEEDDVGDNPAELVTPRLRRWFEELACDALALGMIGPAYVFALADLDLALDRWTQPRAGPGFATHPGLSLRLSYLIPLAERNYFAGELGPAAARLLDGLHELLEDLPDVEEGILAEERVLLDAALANLADTGAIEDVLGLARYLEDDFAREVELVREKIAAGIPPAERLYRRRAGGEEEDSDPGRQGAWSQPMAWQSIMNGAYAYWLEGGADSTRTEDHRIYPDRRRVARDWIEFNAYVRGTIELANLHFQLRESRERLDGLNEPKED